MRNLETEEKKVMYLRIVRFTLEPGLRSTAEKLDDEFVPLIRDQNGCYKCFFITDDDAGDYGIIVLWESKEAAGAAAEIVGPRLTKALSDITDAPDSRQLFEIYEPK